MASTKWPKKQPEMFQPDQGFGLGKWLYWFFGVMVIYAVAVLFPKNRIAASIAAFFAIIGIAIIRYQIAKLRSKD
jgi:hypothetical protein